jgi:hypothetical protein
VAHARGPVSPVRSTGTGTGTGLGAGRWEQREIELGLGLTWAPTKIRVREWTPGSVDSAGSGRTGAGAREVIDGGKDRNAQARALQREREMEKRVREREGARRTRERLAEYELGYMRSHSRTDREITGRFRDVLGTEGFEAFKKCEYLPPKAAALLIDSLDQTCAGSMQNLFLCKDRLGYLGAWNACWIKPPCVMLARARKTSYWTIW